MATGWQVERPEILEEVEALGILIRDTDSSLLAFASSSFQRRCPLAQLSASSTLGSW